MSTIDNLIHYLLDEKRRLSSKAVTIVFIILSVYVVDNVLGFSYYYNNSRKTEQVHILNSIITDLDTDSTTRIFAHELRAEVMDRQNIFKNIASYIKRVEWGKSNLPSSDYKKRPNIVLKSNFWFHLTSGGTFYFFSIIILPILIFSDKNTSFPQRLATGILAAAVFFGIGFFFHWIFTFIPQISNTSWVWNYIANSILQATLVGILVLASKSK